MIYINGDQSGYYADFNGCHDKDMPIEDKPYIIHRKIYFAKHSQNWGGGVAFLNYRTPGLTYGKIYKLKKSQFLDIYYQEHQSKEYDALIYLGEDEQIPVFTFTSSYKLKDIEKPSKKYLDVIKDGLKETYKDLTVAEINEYLLKICQENR